jgi:hypothetical protein
VSKRREGLITAFCRLRTQLTFPIVLRGDLDGFAQRHRAASQSLAQRLAVDQLGDEEGMTVDFVDVVDRQDRRFRADAALASCVKRRSRS